jgi:hypothetical protein
MKLKFSALLIEKEFQTMQCLPVLLVWLTTLFHVLKATVSVLLLDILRMAPNNTVLDSKGATTAQVTPLELTTKLMDAAIKMGTKLVMGAVEGIDIVEGKVVGVRIAGMIMFLKKGIINFKWIAFAAHSIANMSNIDFTIILT